MYESAQPGSELALHDVHQPFKGQRFLAVSLASVSKPTAVREPSLPNPSQQERALVASEVWILGICPGLPEMQNVPSSGLSPETMSICPPRILIPVLYTSILLAWVSCFLIPKGDAQRTLMQLSHKQKGQHAKEAETFRGNLVPHEPSAVCVLMVT